jgi:hypothetical protein
LSVRAIAAVIVALCALSEAAVADPTADLAEAERHWRDLDFDLVVVAAQRVTADASSTRDQRVEALRLEGSALVVLDRNDEATRVFGELFALAPDYELPEGTSPSILSVFRPARAAWQVGVEERLARELGPDLAAVTMTVRLPPAPARGGSPIAVAIDVADPKHLGRDIVLWHRRRGTHEYSSLAAPARPGLTTLSIPGSVTASPKPYDLELHVRLRHASGAVLRRAGTPDEPLSLAVTAGRVPSSDKPITKRWWFWPAVGLVATAAVAIPILADRARDVGAQDVVFRR